MVEEQVKKWTEQGIEPCSSEYASPLVVVKKKERSERLGYASIIDRLTKL